MIRDATLEIHAPGNPSLPNVRGFGNRFPFLCYLNFVSLNGRSSSNFDRKQTKKQIDSPPPRPNHPVCISRQWHGARHTIMFEEPRQRRELLYNINNNTDDAPAFWHSKGLFIRLVVNLKINKSASVVFQCFFLFSRIDMTKGRRRRQSVCRLTGPG